MTRVFAFTALLALLLAGCSDTFSIDNDNTPVCVADTTDECICNTGAMGIKTCDDDGLGYGNCECLPDGGAESSADAGADGGTPADAGGTPDASMPTGDAGSTSLDLL